MTPFARWLSVAASCLALLLAAGPCFASKSDDESSASDDAKSGDEAADASDASKKDSEEKPKSGDEKPKDEGASKDEAFGHMGQLGLRAGIVLGYRMVLRYDNSPYCAPPKPDKPPDKQQKFCGYGAPLAVDLGLSFAVLDFLEPFAWARFGLAADTKSDTNPLILVGAGVRIYTMSDAAFKIFIEPGAALEFEDGRGTAAWQTINPEYKTDLVFHLAAGPQLDFHKNFGAYATGGVSMGVIRALGSTLDLNIGIQGRLP